MSVLVVATTEGMDQHSYEAVQATMGRSSGLPDRCSAHYAGPVDGGWRVVAVWESAESAAAYARNTLGPALARHGLRMGAAEITELVSSESR